MLDDAAIHVGDPQRAVRAGVCIDRAKALVGAGEELLARLHIFAGDDAVFFREDEALHEIGRGLRDKGIAEVTLAEKIAAENSRAASGSGGGELSVGAERLAVVAAVHSGRGCDGPGALVFHDLHSGARCAGPVRVALIQGFRDEIRPEEVAVEIVKLASVIVLSHAPLAARGCAVADEFAVLELVAGGVVGVVDPVIEKSRGGV